MNSKQRWSQAGRLTLWTATAALFTLGNAWAQAAPELAEAEVRRVDREAAKVTLKHGPIRSLDMPPMTMTFQVRNPALFDRLIAGQKILFSVERQQGAYVVTDVRPAP